MLAFPFALLCPSSGTLGTVSSLVSMSLVDPVEFISTSQYVSSDISMYSSVDHHFPRIQWESMTLVKQDLHDLCPAPSSICPPILHTLLLVIGYSLPHEAHSSPFSSWLTPGPGNHLGVFMIWAELVPTLTLYRWSQAGRCHSFPMSHIWEVVQPKSW